MDTRIRGYDRGTGMTEAGVSQRLGYDPHVKDDSYWVLPKALRHEACSALIFGADSSF